MERIKTGDYVQHFKRKFKNREILNMSEKRLLGPGCKACPVREFGHCDTITYRGSRCAELRDEIGLDDPETVTPVNYTYRGIHCIGAIYGVSPMRFLLDKDGKYVDFQYENPDDFYPVDELEFVEKAIDAFLEQEAAKESASLKEQLEKYKAVFGDILFPAKPGTEEFAKRRDIQDNPAGKWMYSFDGIEWKTVPQDTGKIDFRNAMLRRIPEGVVVGVTNDVKAHPDQYEYSTDNGYTWHTLCHDYVPFGHVWIYHGNATWFRKAKKA